MSAQESQEKLQELQEFLSGVATSLNDGKPDTLLACMAKKFGNQFHKKVSLTSLSSVLLSLTPNVSLTVTHMMYSSNPSKYMLGTIHTSKPAMASRVIESVGHPNA